MMSLDKNSSSNISCEQASDPRRLPSKEHKLFPVGASWMDLIPENTERPMRLVFACLESGVLEAWQDTDGAVRLYLPECCGGHLIVAGPDDGIDSPNRDECDTPIAEPDALVRRPGAAWIPLPPGICRARARPNPRMAATDSSRQGGSRER